MKTAQTASSAKGMCQSNGMQLYAATSDLEWQGLSTGLSTVLPSGSGIPVWIDGVQDADGSWNVYNPSKTPLAPMATPTSAFNSLKPCLSISNAKGNYMSSAFNCGLSKIWYVCEFKLASATTTTSTTTTTPAPTTTTTSKLIFKLFF